jgi:hypothetical protein
MTPHGDVSNPSTNADMISTAFWKVKGNEFKITRSNDGSHTALLQTTSNCLQGGTFRSMGTFVMVLSGGVTSVVEDVKLVTAVSTKLLQVLNSTVAAAIFRAVITLGFGVIGLLVMVQ